MHLLGATDESTERKLVVRALVLDLLDLISIRSNSLEHTAHATDEANLLLEDFATMAFGLSFNSLLILISLLLA